MESLRAFAKVGFNILNNQNEKSAKLNGKDLPEVGDNDDLDFDLSSGFEIEINDDAKLFHSLNRFITLLNNREKCYRSKIDNFTVQEIKETNPLELTERLFKDTGFDNKYMTQFIRHNLIKYLRNAKLYSESEEVTTELRDVLSHWWSYTLDLLTSNSINQNNKDPQRIINRGNSIMSLRNTEQINKKDLFQPYISIELVSVCLESISRIMSRLLIRGDYNEIDITKYSDSIIRTIHIITFKLVNNSRQMKELSYNKHKDNHKQITYCNNYNSLIRSFLGKLLAFAFIYIPDELQFDIQLIEALQPTFKLDTVNDPQLITWKKKTFKTTKRKTVNKENEKGLSPNSDKKKMFRVIISYIRNDLCFFSFYFYYWSIIFRMLEKSKITLQKDLIFEVCPGSDIFIEHSINNFLKNDLYKANKHLKNIRKQNLGINVNDSMPNSDIISDGEDTGCNGPNKLESLDDFINSTFKNLKIWGSLHLVYRKFPQQEDNLNLLLNLHDIKQLEYIKTIPAYDYHMANIVFNKILKRIIELFDGAVFLNWSVWGSGYLSLLKTQNMNNQIISILSLFNIWEYIPMEERTRISKEMLGNDEIWSSLTLDTAENLVHVLFSKLLIFKISKINDEEVKNLALKQLTNFHFQFNSLSQILKSNDTNNSIERSCSSAYGGDAVLLFHINKKFVLGTLKAPHSNKSNKYKVMYDKRNWILGPLDTDCRKEFKGLLEPPEFIKLGFLVQENKSKMGFRIMIFPNISKPVEYWNKKWSTTSESDQISNEKELPFKPIEPLNISLFGDINEIPENPEPISTKFNRQTQYEKLFRFIRLFNLTMVEYYDFQNFENDENIYIDFDLFK
ncbi:hypothetical protein C6P45_001644 [Maudiozyma exigua]|uniref:Uncharacterized protein n=1 Tax=Maudiozyma exigua TaxID=34358 RepID=A0A9P6WF92_MAUEX|nr:hypothetical protein C6P45_001644 [Kazachstania exigua]